MITVKDILSCIETFAPTYMKEEWDRVGLNCGHTDAPVTKILVALDPFREVCLEAKELGAELLVTHHALLWEPGFITDLTEQGRNALFLMENRIAHINAHTNLDCAPGGVNDTLAQALGLENVEVVEPVGSDAQGRPYGLLRMGTVPQQALDSFLRTVKNALGCEGLKFVSAGKAVQKVCVGGGACGGELKAAHAAGCDTFVTSDLRYNMFRDAYDLGMNLVDAGHFHTENPVCNVLAQKLQAAFPEIRVILSKKNTDHTKFYV